MQNIINTDKYSILPNIFIYVFTEVIYNRKTALNKKVVRGVSSSVKTP